MNWKRRRRRPSWNAGGEIIGVYPEILKLAARLMRAGKNTADFLDIPLKRLMRLTDIEVEP